VGCEPVYDSCDGYSACEHALPPPMIETNRAVRTNETGSAAHVRAWVAGNVPSSRLRKFKRQHVGDAGVLSPPLRLWGDAAKAIARTPISGEAFLFFMNASSTIPYFTRTVLVMHSRHTSSEAHSSGDHVPPQISPPPPGAPGLDRGGHCANGKPKRIQARWLPPLVPLCSALRAAVKAPKPMLIRPSLPGPLATSSSQLRRASLFCVLRPPPPPRQWLYDAPAYVATTYAPTIPTYRAHLGHGDSASTTHDRQPVPHRTRARPPSAAPVPLRYPLTAPTTVADCLSLPSNSPLPQPPRPPLSAGRLSPPCPPLDPNTPGLAIELRRLTTIFPPHYTFSNSLQLVPVRWPVSSRRLSATPRREGSQWGPAASASSGPSLFAI